MHKPTLQLLATLAFASGEAIVQLATARNELDTRLANVHISASGALEGGVDVTYGECDGAFEDAHHILQRGVDVDSVSRLVWIIPEDASEAGCLAAWETGKRSLVGRSESLRLRHRKRSGAPGGLFGRTLTPVKMNSDSGIDVNGPWFDGVAYLKSQGASSVDEKKAKAKKIGIVGGGPSGMMSAILLESVGFKNYEILEASNRLGGRIRTMYLEGGPDDYQYQEMGPMRFPAEIRYADTNETLEINDHKIVFQLADYLNKLNKNDPKLAVKFIEFIQNSPNAPRYVQGIKNADGSFVTSQESLTDPRFAPESTEALEDASAKISSTFLNKERMASIAKNMFKAHKQFIDEGWENWSEFGYLHSLLGVDLDTTDMRLQSGSKSWWGDIFENAYFSATFWKTIDKGLEQIPVAFKPHLQKYTRYNRRIEKLDTKNGKVQLYWRNNYKSERLQSAEYDYALISAPFTQVRSWRLPRLTSKLTRAIQHLDYDQACKVALQFKTRFWEHLDKPIFGGCPTTDIPGVGSFCYPSYKLNSTGPGVMLASYSVGDIAIRQIPLSEEEHVQRTLNAMVEIHGDIARTQYTGRYNQKCWIADENIAAGWASPSAGQHELFIPQYFETVNNTIFIGEHTSYTHAWIASALESAIRGTVQLCLDMGLVDEAKEITQTWMGRWISV